MVTAVQVATAVPTSAVAEHIPGVVKVLFTKKPKTAAVVVLLAGAALGVVGDGGSTAWGKERDGLQGGLGYPRWGWRYSSARTGQQGDPAKAWAFTGRTLAAAADVRARVTGHLARVIVRDGDLVKKGDLLAEIDARPFRLDLDAAQARLKAAAAKFQAAKIKTTSDRKALENKTISPEELALTVTQEESADAAALLAKAEVGRAELALSWTKVTAPLDGRVGRIQAAEGDAITADQTTIMRVVANDPLVVTFGVSEDILLLLRRDGLAGTDKLAVAVAFAGEEGYPHAAKLVVIEPEVDTNSGKVQFRATVSNPKGLLSPGMSVRVRLSPIPK